MISFTVIPEMKFGFTDSFESNCIDARILPNLQQQFANAEQLYSQRNYEEATKLYFNCAIKGHIDAMNNLAIAYQEGEGIHIDYKKARKWLHNSADNGNVDAQKITLD